MATARDIIGQAREWLDDEIGADENPDESPALWPQKRLIRYADEAQMEFLLRTRMLVDSETAAVCRIAIVPGQASYPMHKSIIAAQRVEFQPPVDTGRSFPLLRTTFGELDIRACGWRERTAQPRAVVQDIHQRKFTLSSVPRPEDDGAFLNLVVWRMPLDNERLLSNSQQSLVRDEYAAILAHWVCHRALLTTDAETRNEALSASHLGQFEMSAGPRPTIAQLHHLAIDQNNTVVGYHF